METTEIMATNEEVIDVMTDEIVTEDSGNALSVIAGVGLAVLGGVMLYKFAVKPLIAKIKAKKEEKANSGTIECENYNEVVDEESVD